MDDKEQFIPSGNIEQRGFDLIIALDQGSADFFSQYPERWFQSRHVRKVVLDHHEARRPPMDDGYIANASSTCELIARIYGIDEIDEKNSALLYLGMCSDTGSFSYKKEYGDAKQLGELLANKAGKTDQELRELKTREPAAEKYEEAYFKNIAIIMPPDEKLPQLIYSYLTREEATLISSLENPKYHRSRVRSGIMHHMSQMNDEGVMFTILPSTEGLKRKSYSIMLRRGNNNNLNLNELAKTFGRGGHDGAASFDFSIEISDLNHLMKDNNLSEWEAIAQKISEIVYNHATSNKSVEQGAPNYLVELQSHSEPINEISDYTKTSDPPYLQHKIWEE